MQTDFETLHVERTDDNILIVALDRPEVANAKNTKMGIEQKGIFESLYVDTEGVRCVVLTGRGKVFYTGLGHPDDFQEPAFRQLLVNAIQWAVD